jgi:hypothetical protein
MVVRAVALIPTYSIASCEQQQYWRRCRDKFIGELFLLDSSVCGRKKFDSPFTFARDPRGAFNFLTARSVGSPVSNGAPAIDRASSMLGMIWHINLTKIAMQLIVFKYCERQDRQLADIEKDIGSCYRLLESSINNVPGSIPLL